MLTPTLPEFDNSDAGQDGDDYDDEVADRALEDRRDDEAEERRREWQRDQPTLPDEQARRVASADLANGVVHLGAPAVYRVVCHSSHVPPRVKRIDVVSRSAERAIARVARGVERAGWSIANVEVRA